MQNSKKAPKKVPVDGILGLGRGSVDLVSQLKHSGVTWVPMAPTTPE
jgi:hypothetical protein